MDDSQKNESILDGATPPQTPPQNVDAPQIPPQTPPPDPTMIQTPPQATPMNPSSLNQPISVETPAQNPPTPMSPPMSPAQSPQKSKNIKLITIISVVTVLVLALAIAIITLAANGTFAMWWTSSTDAATVAIGEKTGTFTWKNNWTWLDYDQNWSEETTSKNQQILRYQPSGGDAYVTIDSYTALDKVTTEDFSSEEVRDTVYNDIYDQLQSNNSYAENLQAISNFQLLHENGDEDNKQTYYYAIIDWTYSNEIVRQFYVVVPERNVIFSISADVDKYSDFAQSPQKMHGFYRDALAVIKTITTSLSVSSDEELSEWNLNKYQRSNITLGTKMDLDGTYKIFDSGTLSFSLSDQQLTVTSRSGEKTQTIAFRDVKTAEKYSNGRKVKYYQFVYDSSSGNEIQMTVALIDHGTEGIEIQYNRTQGDYTSSTQYGVKTAD